jgi:hypothetical protein
MKEDMREELMKDDVSFDDPSIYKESVKCNRKEYVKNFISLKIITCVECGCEMRYCRTCKAYHHTDSFKEEHIEMNRGE